jgi:hypothetical protein
VQNRTKFKISDSNLYLTEKIEQQLIGKQYDFEDTKLMEKLKLKTLIKISILLILKLMLLINWLG